MWSEASSTYRYETRYEMPRATTWRFRAWNKSGSLYVDGTGSPNYYYTEEVPTLTGSDSRIIGKHYEYDSVSTQQTKRYYGAGRLLATRTGTTLRYIQPDHLGSSSTLTDSNGYVVIKERYSAFGERRQGESSHALITDQLYTAQRYNALSSLYHYSDGSGPGRFYDPVLGRFVQADRKIPGIHSAALNRYSYTFNNPVQYVDPNGHIPIIPIIIGGVIIGSKIIDYGLTAWDIHQSIQTLQDKTSSNLDRSLASLNIIIAMAAEAAEPDEALPISVPADDVARRGLIKMARDALVKGDTSALNQLPGWLQPIVRGMATEIKVLDKLGIKKNTETLTGLVDGKKVSTIPDILDHGKKSIGGIKDVAELGWDSQIRAQYEAAVREGYEYTIYVRRDTKLVGELKDRVEDDLIKVRYIEDIVP